MADDGAGGGGFEGMFSRSRQGPPPVPPNAVADTGAVLLFAVLALVCTALWWRGRVPFPFLGSDLANISSYAAALLHPERFVGDIAIGDPKSFRFYLAAHVPLLMVLGPWVGDFGGAALLLLPIVLLIQTLGFYVLGRLLFGHRFYAMLLALMSLGKVDLTIDYIGSFHDVEPRFLFQAFLPWLLASVIRFGDRPSLWPMIMAGAGLLIYVHPVSAPSVAFATWLGLWAYRVETIPVAFLRLLVAGVVFLLVSAPFLWVYLKSREYGASDDAGALLEAQRQLIGAEFFDFRGYIREAMRNPVVWGVSVWGLTGLAVVIRQQGGGAPVRFLVLWAAGLLMASVGLTAVEQQWTALSNRLPLAIDLIRNIRYLPVILLISGFWGVLLLLVRLEHRRKVAVICVAVVYLLVNRPGMIPFRETLQCWAQGKILCPPADSEELIASLAFLRDRLPQATPILSVVHPYSELDFTMAIRYHAFQPVVYSPKDGGSTLAYGNWRALRQWLEIRQAIGPIQDQQIDSRERGDRALQLARQTGASVIVADQTADEIAIDTPLLFRAGKYHIYSAF